MATIHFIGGVHGVGKGTVCNKICKQVGLTHLSASELLKWGEISTNDNKKVKDIKDTQERLLTGINNATQKGKSYLLDGHFCLFNAKGVIEKVPKETFAKIAPKSIAIVATDVILIKQRLEARDKKIYELEILEYMQNTEKEYAEEVATILDIPFFEIKDGNHTKLVRFISKVGTDG